MLTEKANAFWVDDDGKPFRLGELKDPMKGKAQVGYHLAPRYTIQEYAEVMKAYSLAHAAALSPEIKAAIGHEVAMAEAFAPMAPPPPAVDTYAPMVPETYSSPGGWAMGYF